MSATTDYTERHTPGARDDLERPSRRFDEAKAGFKSSEFYVMGAFVAAVLLTTYLDADSLNRDDGWLFAAFAVVAYIVSRGLAKLGVRQPADTDQ